MSFTLGLQLCQVSVELVFWNPLSAVELGDAAVNLGVDIPRFSKSQRSCSSCVSSKRSSTSSMSGVVGREASDNAVEGPPGKLRLTMTSQGVLPNGWERWWKL